MQRIHTLNNYFCSEWNMLMTVLLIWRIFRCSHYLTIISNLTSWLKSCNNWMKLIWCAFEIDQNKHCFETFYFIFIDIYLHRRRKWHLWLNSFRTKSKNFESFKLKSFFLIVQIIESCNFLIIYYIFLIYSQSF